MARYIDADALYAAVMGTEFLTMQDAATMGQLITEAPTAEVEPFVQAHWQSAGKLTKCSNCGNPAVYTLSGRLNLATRCDLCGAHMR